MIEFIKKKILYILLILGIVSVVYIMYDDTRSLHKSILKNERALIDSLDVKINTLHQERNVLFLKIDSMSKKINTSKEQITVNINKLNEIKNNTDYTILSNDSIISIIKSGYKRDKGK